jgi:hypothetical protein
MSRVDSFFDSRNNQGAKKSPADRLRQQFPRRLTGGPRSFRDFGHTRRRIVQLQEIGLRCLCDLNVSLWLGSGHHAGQLEGHLRAKTS